MKTIPLFLLMLAAPALSVAAQTGNAAKGRTTKTNVAGVDVTGLDNTQRERRLRRELDKRLDAKVLLTDGKRSTWRRRRDIGAELDLGWMQGQLKAGKKYVPLRLSVDGSTLQRALRRLEPAFHAAPQNARIGLVNGKMKIVPEQAGRSLNVGASVPRVKAQIERSAGDKTLRLASRISSPKVTRADFKGITGVLSTFPTSFNPGNVKRTTNMRVAIRAIDGTIVPNGRVFSLNQTVGERTQKRGYRTSIIFLNGYKVPGIGAGVSQVTGTLFNAALQAGLPIVEFRTHSRPVTYLPIGRDATVAWGSFDNKWKNNTGAPIYISYKIKGNRAIATLFGRRVPEQKVSLRVVSKNLGERKIAAQLYRTIRRNGKVVKKEKVGTSNYNWKVGAWED
jgi:vancomycin resistance protein YoaR